MRRSFVALLVAIAVSALTAAPAKAAFGIHNFDVTFTGPDGSAVAQAGAHPFAMTTSFGVNDEVTKAGPFPVELVKDVLVAQIPGFVGDQTAVPPCSTRDFLNRSESTLVPECSNSSVVGIANVQVRAKDAEGHIEAPLYSIQHAPGKAAKLGFYANGVPVTIDVALSETSPYNLIAESTRISQVLEFLGAEITLWGVPGAAAHDEERGTCLVENRLGGSSLKCPAGVPAKPFLTLPRACQGPLSTSYLADSWENPGVFVSGAALTHNGAVPPNPQGMIGCARLGFAPQITATPTSHSAESPTGLDFNLDIDDEGLTNASGIADSDIRSVQVTLPEGMTINPSQAEGLGVCGEADLARETASSPFGAGCPAESKIGTVEVETPLLEGAILKGSLFVAAPYENPFSSLVALYMTIKDPELGVGIRLAGKVTPDPRTGQLVTTFGDPAARDPQFRELPQLPFSHFRLRFREGTRSPLSMPPACGTYTTNALLTPASDPDTTRGASSTFTVRSGVRGGPCPSGGTPPFVPGLGAGTLNNAAGAYSPFDVRLTREDGEQEITHFSIKLPPGVTGKLAGIPFCSDLQIAAAKARERTPHGGQEELDHPSCPAASEIGRTLAGAGVGPSLTYVPGKVYLAGPYHGSNLSIVAITAAKAGPFDLGTVVVREAIKVDPETAEVSVDAAGSDPLPHIVEGIPVHLRDIRVYVDRSQFMLNPTSCAPTSTASTVLGSGTNFATEADDRPVTVTTRFQAADCAALGFRPRIKLMLKGQTKRTGLPRLKAVVRPRPGDANIGRAVVTLPRSEFLEQGHIGTTCTRVQFNAGGGNGEQCPAKSVYGRARAWTPLLSEPLTGPVFLRSNGGERKLPDLVAALHSKLIDVDLLGFIKSLHPKGASFSRIRTIFASVPDAPVSRFTLEMFGGKKGLLINSVNLCKGRHRAISNLVGQNGKKDETHPAVRVKCKRKGKHHRKAHGHSRHTRRGGVHLPGRRRGR